MLHKRKIVNFTKKINKVIVLLTFSDMFTWGGYLVMTYLAGLYLERVFGTKTVEFIGLGSAVFFITKALTQIPIGYLMDHSRSDSDEIIFLALGPTLIGLSLMSYPLINSLWVFMLLQFIIGLGYTFNVTSWRKMFAQNVDKGRVGMQYSIYDTATSISTAILTALGGAVASISEQYFSLVFVCIGLISICGGIIGLLLFFVRDRKTKTTQE